MDETLNEKMLEAEPRWHPASEINDEIMMRLAALMRLGYCEQSALETDPRGFCRIVAGTLSACWAENLLGGCIASMPAVQRAMKAAYTELSVEERYRAIVLAIARMLGADGEALLAAELKPREVDPRLGNVTSRDIGPVN
jgi:hypothetical protein